MSFLIFIFMIIEQNWKTMSLFQNWPKTIEIYGTSNWIINIYFTLRESINKDLSMSIILYYVPVIDREIMNWWLHVRKGYTQKFALDIAKKKIIEIKPHKYESSHIHTIGIRVMMFNATFNNISVTVSFIGGGNQSTRRKPPTSCCKSLTNFITWCCIEYTSLWVGWKLTTLWW